MPENVADTINTRLFENEEADSIQSSLEDGAPQGPESLADNGKQPVKVLGSRPLPPSLKRRLASLASKGWSALSELAHRGTPELGLNNAETHNRVETPASETKGGKGSTGQRSSSDIYNSFAEGINRVNAERPDERANPVRDNSSADGTIRVRNPQANAGSGTGPAVENPTNPQNNFQNPQSGPKADSTNTAQGWQRPTKEPLDAEWEDVENDDLNSIGKGDRDGADGNKAEPAAKETTADGTGANGTNGTNGEQKKKQPGQQQPNPEANADGGSPGSGLVYTPRRRDDQQPPNEPPDGDQREDPEEESRNKRRLHFSALEYAEHQKIWSHRNPNNDNHTVDHFHLQVDGHKPVRISTSSIDFHGKMADHNEDSFAAAALSARRIWGENIKLKGSKKFQMKMAAHLGALGITPQTTAKFDDTDLAKIHEEMTRISHRAEYKARGATIGGMGPYGSGHPDEGGSRPSDADPSNSAPPPPPPPPRSGGGNVRPPTPGR